MNAYPSPLPDSEQSLIYYIVDLNFLALPLTPFSDLVTVSKGRNTTRLRLHHHCPSFFLKKKELSRKMEFPTKRLEFSVYLITTDSRVRSMSQFSGGNIRRLSDLNTISASDLYT